MSGHLTLAPEGKTTFDTEEAADYVGCSPGYLKKLRQVGCGPAFHRLFRRKGIKYTRGDLNSWIASRRFSSTTDYPETLP